MRRLSQKQKVPFKRSRWLLLKNPWNLSNDQKQRLSTLVQWNLPIVRAYYLKEAFQLFWLLSAAQEGRRPLEKWMRSAMLPTGALQAIHRHAAWTSRWDCELDQ